MVSTFGCRTTGDEPMSISPRLDRTFRFWLASRSAGFVCRIRCCAIEEFRCQSLRCIIRPISMAVSAGVCCGYASSSEVDNWLVLAIRCAIVRQYIAICHPRTLTFRVTGTLVCLCARSHCGRCSGSTTPSQVVRCSPVVPVRYHCAVGATVIRDVLSVNDGFNQHRIPYDALWLDIDHTNDRRYFTWNGALFPDSLRMIQQLDEKGGRKLVTITDPHIKVDPHYHVYQQGHAKGYFVKNTGRGDEFHGHCWPGESVWIDFMNPAARSRYSSLFVPSSYVGSNENVSSWIDD